MAWRGGRNLSLVVTAVGAVLLVLAATRQAPTARPDPPHPDDPPVAADPADPAPDPVKLAAVSLPPPPAPTPKPALVQAAQPKPAPAPEPAPKAAEIHPLKPLPVAEATPPAPRVVEPLKAPAPKPPVRVVKPLAPTPEPEPPAAAKPPPVPEPQPETVRVAEITPMKPHPAPPRVEARPEPPPEVAPAPTEAERATVHVSVRTGGTIASEGRALLRLLEHGSGPTIEIGWPAGTAARSRLYSTLARCYGMRSLLMDGAGNLYVAQGERGRKWDINLDRYSGFVRQPEGYIAADERGEATAISRYHGLRGGAGIVRIFPRPVDSVLLGGLQQVLGSAYAGARTIHATYRQEGTRLYVEGIVADGVPVPGRIAFSSVGGCR